ncbi:MAG: hypothetical protein GY943_38105 [Chloroflexi bacterium]|nr:hypothetical protein [Chloroflexota bacterium]
MQKTVLSLGFSFGIWPDGTPGRCNQQLAQDMGKVEKKLRKDSLPRIAGEQWELADASEGRFVRPGRHYICKPPSLTCGDILQPELIRERVENPSFPAEKRLQALLVGQCLQSDVQMVGAFNQLLQQRDIFKLFQDVLAFEDLIRSDKGMLGIEKRLMPQSGADLHQYQAMRVNRLIFEAIFDASILKRTVYLNTEGVVKNIFERVEGETAVSIQTILIFCHPLHLFWCGYNIAKQILSFSNRINFDTKLVDQCVYIVDQFKIINTLAIEKRANHLHLLERSSPMHWGELVLGLRYDPNAKWCWDSQSAQVWTRSIENYDKYNAI